MIENPDGTLKTNEDGSIVIENKRPNRCARCLSGLVRVTYENVDVEGIARLISVTGDSLIESKTKSMKNGELWHIKEVGIVFKKINRAKLRLVSRKVPSPATTHEQQEYIADFTRLAAEQGVTVTC